MSQAQNDNIDELIGCSEKMLKHAEAGDWKSVALAEQHRRELINRLFRSPAANNGIPEINKIIQTIITINKKLEGLTIDARDKARSKIDKIKEGRLAVNSYVQHI